MNQKINYKHYVQCIKEVLIATFDDKNIRCYFFFSLIVLIIGILSHLSIPILLKKIVDTFSNKHSFSITFILFSYGLIWIISQISQHVQALLIYKIEQRITFTLGIKTLSHLFGLSHSYFINQKPGALTNVIRRAQRDIPSIVLGLFVHIVPTVLEFLAVIILISNLYPLIYSLFMIGILSAFFVYTYFSMQSIVKGREAANEVDKNADGIITDWLSNHEAIKIFNKNKFVIQICEAVLKNKENTEVSFLMKYSLARMGQTVILGVGLGFLTYFIGQDVLKGTLTIGDFILFNGYILQFIIPIGIIGQATQEMRKALLDLKGIIEILLTQSDVKELSQPLHLKNDQFQIAFDNVSFKYHDRFIIKNVSFRIQSGETALIVGSTGAGKSTIAKLMLRLYDPTEGNILINHINLKHISLNSLYNAISWVPQETYLVNDTILNNMYFVHPDASLKEIEEALDQAQLLNFIRKLPLGFNTLVGNRGLKLSGGEKQRLSLARIFLKKPKICIFDESTSSLDMSTDYIIQNNIIKFLPQVTKIIITHRPFVAHEVDQIISLDENSLVQQKNDLKHNF